MFVHRSAVALCVTTPPTASSREVQFYNSQAKTWWDTSGPFALLRKYNRVRIPFIEEQLSKANRQTLQTKQVSPLKGCRVLDVGTGGGLLAEALAEKGAYVVGIDVSSASIEMAKSHRDLQSSSSITPNPEYYETDVTTLCQSNPRLFDVVVASEVIEHVESVELFFKSCVDLLQPGGVLVITTPNRTPLSYLLLILGAEYIAKFLPKGTHQYSKFIRPSELKRLAQVHGLEPLDTCGSIYVPILGLWFREPTGWLAYLSGFKKRE